MSKKSKEELVKLARLAEQSERYEDMVKDMKEVVEMDQVLNDEERNLLSVAYKNVVGARRSSWRVIKSMLEKEKKDNAENPSTEEYLSAIKEELDTSCKDVIQLLNNHLLIDMEKGDHPPEVVEAQVFYLKMKGDYYRYLVEVAEESDESTAEENKESLIAKSQEAYEKATEIAGRMPTTNPIRLGLALNFSVFFFEIKKNPEKACQLAKKAFDDAIAELDSLSEDCYKDSTLIMQLLRDNLTLWTSDSNDEQDGDQ